MRVYYLPKDKHLDKILLSDPRQIHHLADVLRLKPGDELSAFDGKENECLCKIEEISKDQVTLRILRSKTTSSNNPVITLACAIPKNVKMDYIIEKTTELGVSRIIPLHTQRTIVKIPSHKAAAKQERWQRIAQEASKQCQRIKFPVIERITEFKNALNQISGYDLAIIPNLEKEPKTISSATANFKGKSVLIFIGPEGDFTPEEIAAAKEKGCIGVSLGDLTLKVDTAAIATVAYFRFCSL